MQLLSPLATMATSKKITRKVPSAFCTTLTLSAFTKIKIYIIHHTPGFLSKWSILPKQWQIPIKSTVKALSSENFSSENFGCVSSLVLHSLCITLCEGLENNAKTKQACSIHQSDDVYKMLKCLHLNHVQAAFDEFCISINHPLLPYLA